ncbi:MAG: hypothetical protein ACOYK6_06860 [Chthoniobacterales bacterium]
MHCLFLSMALFSSVLLAQQAEVTTRDIYLPPDSVGVKVDESKIHFGTHNKYKIQINGGDVLVNKFCDFLNYSSCIDDTIFESKYYDSSFMNTSFGWWSDPINCIYSTGYSHAYGSGYSYSVILFHCAIIDAVSSEEIQDEFNAWVLFGKCSTKEDSKTVKSNLNKYKKFKKWESDQDKNPTDNGNGSYTLPSEDDYKRFVVEGGNTSTQ